MKALIYKDLLTLWKNLKMYLLMCVIFQLCSLGGDSFTFMRFYPLILVSSLPHTLIAYDERSGWEKYALCLPVSRKQLVSSKYLVGLLLQSGMLLIASVTNLFLAMEHGHFDAFGYCFELGMNLALGVAVMCVALPATFRMGSEKGRLVNVISYGVLAAVLVITVLLGSSLGLSDITLNEWVIVPFLLLPAIILPASWLLSIHWYEKREF